MIDSKNQIIRSMKSYAEGGSTDDSCMEEYISSDGKKRKRRKNSCGKKTKFRSSSKSSSGGGGGVLGTILGAGAAVGAGLGLKKMLDKNKKGGAIKTLVRKQKGGSTWSEAGYQGVTKTTPTRGGGTKEKSFTKLNGYAGQSGYLTKTKRDAEGMVIKEKQKSISPARVDRVEKRVESKLQRKGGPVKTMKKGGLVAKKK